MQGLRNVLEASFLEMSGRDEGAATYRLHMGTDSEVMKRTFRQTQL